ncbi:class I SAM-dependent methyltransferase [Longispora sp. NPDC051575]|uniref:class I SAM-dependent methyltransferase n=1 Tax=Longispora sp. NPDC051575 TaxID=3154943 RepID=UPI0034248797
MTTALELYETALTTDSRLDYLCSGVSRPAGLERWVSARAPGDGGLLDRCVGHILDVGCGPGRLVAALTGRGAAALGVDVSAAAVRLTRSRGARAVRADVFGRLPREGLWDTVLLADGNIGIGGDPGRLLARCVALLAPGGALLVELDRPRRPTTVTELRLRVDAQVSAPFPWAFVSFTDLPRIAEVAHLDVAETWTRAGRWFAALTTPAPVTAAVTIGGEGR